MSPIASPWGEVVPKKPKGWPNQSKIIFSVSVLPDDAAPKQSMGSNFKLMLPHDSGGAGERSETEEVFS